MANVRFLLLGIGFIEPIRRDLNYQTGHVLPVLT
jgi:hypothetical protein